MPLAFRPKHVHQRGPPFSLMSNSKLFKAISTRHTQKSIHLQPIDKFVHEQVACRVLF